jgi:hypothetical protein
VTAAAQPPLPSTRPAPLPPLSPAAAGTTRSLTLHKPAANEAGAIRQVQYQFGRTMGGIGSDTVEFQIQLLPPSFERLVQIESEDSLRERIRQELRERTPPERALFPEEKPATTEPYRARQFAPQVALAEPGYVNHGRLWFEERNSERYGWDFGVVQPVISTGYFAFDFMTLPYHFASRPCDCTDSSAGKCRPGDPVPYLIYPPGISASGAFGEAAAILAVMAIFP